MPQPVDESGKTTEKKGTALKLQYEIDESGGHPNLLFETQLNTPGSYSFTPDTPGCFWNKLPPGDQKIIKDGVHQSWNILMNTPMVIPNVSQVPAVPPNFQAPTFVTPNFPLGPTVGSGFNRLTAPGTYFHQAPVPRLQFLRAPAADRPLPPVQDEDLGFEAPDDTPTFQWAPTVNTTFQQVPTIMNFQQVQAAGWIPVQVPPPNPIFAAPFPSEEMGVLQGEFPVIETRRYAVPPNAQPQSGNQNPPQ